MHLGSNDFYKKSRVAIMFILLFVVACGSKQQTATTVDKEDPERFNFRQLLFLPVEDMARIYGENVTVQCRLCGNIITTGPVIKGADEILTTNMRSLLQERKDLKLVPMSQAEGTLSDILSSEKEELSERKLLVMVGSELGADAILAGKVYRFIERDGTDYSIKSPASVAFDMMLIRVSDGRTMWTGHFDETQQSLFENIYQWGSFVKRKGKWITAEQLAIDGLNSMFRTFPKP